MSALKIMLQRDFNTEEIRKDFPILTKKVYGKNLVYLDNGATTQKPTQVLDALDKYYKEYNSNVHRGVHLLSQTATDAFEAARRKVAAFLHAQEEHEVIFTKGTTDGINLIAASYGKQFVKEGDSILITAMEHHSNIVPWQMLCEDKNATLKVLPMDDQGNLQMDVLPGLLDASVKLVACTYVSNALGTVNPVEEIIELAHQKNIPVLLDAAQAVQHMAIDVQALDVDFLVFSGHKIYGPTGIGVLYGKEKWLNAMPPYQGGGDMIKTVSFEKTVYNVLPFKFEAGTPDISGAIGLGAAIDYLTALGMPAIEKAERELLQYAQEELKAIPGLRFIGEPAVRSGVISFLINDAHPFDTGELLDKQGVAVRTGHHCCQPIMDFFHIPGTVRASFTFYNNKEDVDKLVAGIKRAAAMLQ